MSEILISVSPLPLERVGSVKLKFLDLSTGKERSEVKHWTNDEEFSSLAAEIDLLKSIATKARA